MHPTPLSCYAEQEVVLTRQSSLYVNGEVIKPFPAGAIEMPVGQASEGRRERYQLFWRKINERGATA